MRLSKQDKLTAGDNITIDENNVISATVPDPVSVDDKLSDTSENPVQNKVITEALGEKQDYFGDVFENGVSREIDLKNAKNETIGQLLVGYKPHDTDYGVALTGLVYPPTKDSAVNQQYVDDQDTVYYDINKEYVDTAVNSISSDVTNLTNDVDGLASRMTQVENTIDDDIKPAMNQLAQDYTSLDVALGNTNQTVENLTSSTTTALSDRYTKSETYNREEIDQKVAGAFKFKGEVASKADLPTDASDGDVYQVGDKEYAYNGTSWVELGFNVDLTAYIKTVDAESKIATAKQEAINTSKTYTDGLVGNINTILATLVDVTSSQSAKSNKDLTIKEVLDNA